MTALPCRTVDPDTFFPDHDDVVGIAAAQALCATCPVRTECEAYALKRGVPHGIFGGVTEWERRKQAKMLNLPIAMSENQRRVIVRREKVLLLVGEGLGSTAIAKRLNLDERMIREDITRMRSAGQLAA